MFITVTPRSQQPSTHPYTKQEKSSPPPPIPPYYFKIYFNIIFPSMSRSPKWLRTNVKRKRMIRNVYWRCESCRMWRCAAGQAAPNVLKDGNALSSGSGSSRRFGSSATLLWEREASQTFIYLFTIYSTTLSTVQIKYKWMIHWSVHELEQDMEFYGLGVSILLCTWQATCSKHGQQTAIILIQISLVFIQKMLACNLQCVTSFLLHHIRDHPANQRYPCTVQRVIK